MLAVFIQASITTDQAVPEQVIYKERPPLMSVNAKEIAKELFDGTQYSCLSKLIGKESAWKSDAQNPTSTASGLGQLLDGTYKRLGMEKSDSAVAQLVATLSYIHRRHVTPCGAWKHFQNKGWY